MKVSLLSWTYREEFEEGILENLPLFILVGNHWDVDFAEILREQEDETDGSEGNRRIRGQHHHQGRHPDPTPPFCSATMINIGHLITSKGLCSVSFRTFDRPPLFTSSESETCAPVMNCTRVI